MSWLGELRTWLFGAPAPATPAARVDATALLEKLLHGSLRELGDPDLMQLVGAILDSPALQEGLRGNRRFMMSVHGRWQRLGRLSPKQRSAIFNILERAYPHNLAATMLRRRE